MDAALVNSSVVGSSAENDRPAESRLLAALAHASILTQGLGILVGVLVYINQREKSRYAAFQALQAAVFQLIALLLVIVVWVVWTIFYMLTFIPLMNMPESAAPPPIFWIGMGSMIIPFGIMALIGGYGLWAAYRVWRGQDFRYMLVGRWLEKSELWQKNE